MYTTNNSGPKTDPCGTPDVIWGYRTFSTYRTEDIVPSATTRWV